MRSAGMSIGSHTWSHRNLAQIADAEVEAELTRSKQVLETRLSAPVSAVAYPWGKLRRHVTERTFAAAARAGYRLGAVLAPTRGAGIRLPARASPASAWGRSPSRAWPARSAARSTGTGPCTSASPLFLARALWPEEAGTRSARHDPADRG